MKRGAQAKLATHRICAEDLRALAIGDLSTTVISQLAIAELSKHKILLTALMRQAATFAPAEHADTLAPAYQLLAEVQARDERTAGEVLASAQFGSWAAHCLARLSRPSGLSGQYNFPPLQMDLGQLAAFACAAALRAGHSFALDVPLRHGAVTFPTVGTARPGAGAPWEWGRASLDDRGGRAMSSASVVCIPPGGPADAQTADGWSTISRVSVDCAGLRAEFLLDDRDPHLDRYGLSRATVSGGDLAAWERALAGAWDILARRHGVLAATIAKMVRTLVPLSESGQGLAVSATEAAAFGAIALSLPADALAMAETLVHESHHAILSAVTDLMSLTRPGGYTLAYAPWRDDVRPDRALLQGTFAHFGVAGFWRTQRHHGSTAERFRGNVEFARALGMTAEAVGTLQQADVLTEAGEDFVCALTGELAGWQRVPAPRPATELAAELALDHRIRWRLRHCVPDPAAIGSLAADWREGAKPTVWWPVVRTQVRSQPPLSAAASVRSHLLALRYRDPDRFQRWLRDGGTPPGLDRGGRAADPVDGAFASGNYPAAADGYLRRIASDGDADAWVGLALARQHTGSAAIAEVLAKRPEVVAALHEGLRGCRAPGPDQLATWLAGGTGDV